MGKTIFLLIFAFVIFESASLLYAETLILQGVRIVGQGDSLQDIYLRDGKIQKIEPHKSHPPSASLLDFREKWVMPGLIDLNCSLFSSPGGGFAGEEFSSEQILRNQLSLLKCGITSIRILECPKSRAKEFLQEKENSKKRKGPRVFIAGPILTAKGEEPLPQYRWVDGLSEDLIAEIARDEEISVYFQNKMDCIYVMVSAGKSFSDATLPKFSPEMLRKICLAAKKANLPVIAYVESWEEFQEAVDAGVDQIDGGILFEEAVPQGFLELLKEKNILYCPNLFSFKALTKFAEKQAFGKWDSQIVTQLLLDSCLFPYSVPNREIKEFSRYQSHFQQAQQALNLLKTQQISIGIASNAGKPLTFFGTSIYYQMLLLLESGWSPAECLDSVTRLGAKALGKESELGQIKAGFLADLIVLEGNPLEDFKFLTKVLWVYSNKQGYWTRQLDPQIPVSLKPSPLTSRFIDDFEDGNLLGNNQYNWESFDDRMVGGSSSIKVDIQFDGAETSQRSVKLAGTLVSVRNEVPFAGVELNLVPEKEKAVDISEFQGVEFAAKGKGVLTLKLKTSNVYDFDYYATEVKLDKEWSTYKIPFTKFIQQDFGQEVDWRADQFTGIVFLFNQKRPKIYPIQAQIDEIRFYRK